MSHNPNHTPARSDTGEGGRGSRWRRLALAVAVSATLGVSSVQAQTDDYAEVNRLVRSGQLAEALARADQYLAGKPRDPQMRFLKGVIQTESGRSSEAIATFLQLTEDYPELPEPYNNLAVLYASQSQFDKARVALEMAIRTNPSYATAHENLGDVYAKLASQAYSKALQLDGSNTGVAPKLNLIRSLFAVQGRGAAMTGTSAPVSRAASSPQPSAAGPGGPASAGVEAAVQAWASAWSSRNMQDYLAAYAPDFQPQGGKTRAAWESERRSRIVPRQRIDVDVNDLEVSVDGDRATARFRQTYSSDHLYVTSPKVLEMVRSDNRWLIIREVSGS